ncbi:pyrroline-5-carboxylate reductase [Iris pallida]|uniref:Pyrroline-5-carboxylate reductase n=1 Tax=Iris pallida TaxID=29817 RepID=A0AAX6FQB5_IRIPA|nr:pyrroline-5-carboxylate reductase [Iris pallida]
MDSKIFTNPKGQLELTKPKPIKHPKMLPIATPKLPHVPLPISGNTRARMSAADHATAAAVPLPPESFRVGFVGAGNMAESIARGVAKSGVIPAASIRTAHRRAERRDAFRSFGVEILDDSAKVVDDSDIIILSVKPQMVKNVLLELKPTFSKEKVLVSVAAGIKLKDLQEWSGHRRLIRVMPNTPSAVGEAASVMCMGEMATKKDEERVSSLFGAIGKTWTADEKYFDAVTGLSGSGPAYIYLAIEAMADGGVAAGLPRDLALGLASQTVLGAAAMVRNTGKHPGQLKDAVTSPAGTTIAGIHELEKGGFRGTLMSAVVAATKRCQELSNT